MKSNISDLFTWYPLKQQIEQFYPFEINDLVTFEQILDFSNVSLNRNMSWDIKILGEFAHRLDWCAISRNPSVKWSEELVGKYENYIDWTNACSNKNFPWTKFRFFKYKDIIDWESIDDLPVKLGVDDITFLSADQKRFLAKFKNVDWNPYLIERFKDSLDWGLMGGNPSIPVSEYFFKAYMDRMYFIHVVTNSWLLRDDNLPFLDRIAYVDFNNLSEWKEDWSTEFIRNNEDRLNWDLLSSNQHLPWSDDLLLKYENRWNWHAMSGNRSVPWTWELIEKYEEEWKWGDESDPFLSLYRSMSTNPALPWSQEFVDRFGHHMEFGGVKQLGENGFTFLFGISSNTKINWDLDFLIKYKDRWDIDALAKNEAVYSVIIRVLEEGDILNVLKFFS